ncbi:hypothetical protein C9374_013614 [Naegleria lovaniensis]|uniref:F-box domain-containing protein n=1 Tax=Naegleria lovaniensis TaxID=51637 RepID=A0AA88GBW5_NAELO|nr:uncharacterized protein C9374_013614 [Naegleria lovaniensis]KAG2372713.1 hypothetical protein C9374_013614 [Naegleria lovaniensis]
MKQVIPLLAQALLSNNIVSRKVINHAIQMEERGEDYIVGSSSTCGNSNAVPISLAELKQISMSDVIDYMMYIQKYGSINRLPDEILLSIFMMIEDDDHSWRNFMLTCKRFFEICVSYRLQEIHVCGLGPFTFYQGAPNHFYLTLPHPDRNISMYKIPSRKPWSANDTDVYTTWYKIRVDPSTLNVHTGDFRFAKSVGHCSHHTVNQTQIPYASCFGCEAPHMDDANALCDLTGTPFSFDASFHHNGYMSNGSSQLTNDDKVIKLQGGGYCGWICSVGAKTEDEAVQGGWFIKLKPTHPCVLDDEQENNIEPIGEDKRNNVLKNIWTLFKRNNK